MILLDPQKCQGCRICETACGFHWSGHREFNPSRKCTHISRDNDNAVITMTVDSWCDLCEGEAVPLCVKYCAYGARRVNR